MPTAQATAIKAEIRPKALWVLQPVGFVVRVRIDILVSGRMWETFGFQTRRHDQAEAAKADARELVENAGSYMAGGVREALLEEINALEAE
jgi:hypothetical protein